MILAAKDRPWLTVFVAAIAIRLLFVLATAFDPSTWLAPDSVIYRNLARGILETGSLVRMVADGVFMPETERVPLYGIFLLPFQALFGDNPIFPLLAQALLGAATCVVIASLAGEIDQRSYLPAGLLASACLNMITHGAVILTETLFLFFFALHLHAAARFLRATGWLTLIRSAVWLGLATMTRTVTVYWIPLFSVFVALAALRRNRSGLRAAAFGLCAYCCAFVILLPQYVRNFDGFGHWKLSSQDGTNMLFWYVPLVKEFSAGQTWSKGVAEMKQALRTELDGRGLQQSPSNPFESSMIEFELGKRELLGLGWYAIAKAWVAGASINLLTPSVSSVSAIEKMDRPRFFQTAGGNLAMKVSNFLLHPANHSYLAIVLPGILLTVALRGLFIAGVCRWIARRDGNAIGWLLLASIGYFLLVTGPVVNAARYRIPMEPALIVFSAIGLRAFREKLGVVRRIRT